MRSYKLFLYGIIFITLFGFPKNVYASPVITDITDNKSSYTGLQIPKYEKFEITFQINNSSAQNFQLPYDPSPPAGIKDVSTGHPYSRYNGITVNAIFTSPSGQIFSQPAFYYQDFQSAIKPNIYGEDKEWFYPTTNYSWKVRFSPNEIGLWTYKLSVSDSSGSYTSPSQSPFNVIASGNHGFIKVSDRDTRYFEFSDGTYFPGLGFNMNYDQVDWVNPTLNNQANFQKMAQNGIQLIRIWLSEWSIFGSSWNPWYSIRGDYDDYLPRAGLINYGITSTPDQPSSLLALQYSESGSTQNNSPWFDACRFIGGFQAQPTVKQNVKYHIKIRYKGTGMTGPRDASYLNYGFVAKIQNPNDGNWHTQCYNSVDPINGVRITPYGGNTDSWSYLEGDWNSGTNNYLPILYLAVENVKSSTDVNVLVDTVFMGEDLGNGNYGPNIITKPSMEHLAYYMERNAYAFDKVLELAQKNGIYLRPVVMEKNEVSENEVGQDGKKAEFDNDNFYGTWRNPSAIRWLQAAWLRYLQARWGYSPNIHSWEVTNEAQPGNTNHYAQTDEAGKFMHCTVFGISVGSGDGQKCNYSHPNSHLVSTSFWSSFVTDFWGSSMYPNVDFADVHQYVSKSDDITHFNDTTLNTYDASKNYGSKITGINKPVIRGETGLTDSGTEPGTRDLLEDMEGLWLHNFVWGQINSNGMLESYWYTNYNWNDAYYGHIYSPNFDLRSVFKTYYDFIKDVPLNNGSYSDIKASSNNTNLRVWGQKDVVNSRAHFWISNAQNTWSNVIKSVNITPITDTVKISGFIPNKTVPVVWWNTYLGRVSTTSTITTDSQGVITVPISTLTEDIAIKIGDYSSLIGDFNNDGSVNILDYTLLSNAFGTINVSVDLNNDDIVNILDYTIFSNNFGKSI